MGQISGGGGDSMGDESGVSDWQAARADTFSLAGGAVKFFQEFYILMISTFICFIRTSIYSFIIVNVLLNCSLTNLFDNNLKMMFVFLT